MKILTAAMFAAALACSANAYAKSNQIAHFIVLGAEADAPRGFIEMCRDDPTFCGPNDEAVTTLQRTISHFGEDSTRRFGIEPARVSVDQQPVLQPIALTSNRVITFGIADSRSDHNANRAYFGHFGHGSSIDLASAELPSPALTASGVDGTGSVATLPNLSDDDAATNAIPDLMILARVNKLVNRAVAQRSDEEVYGKEEYWHRSGISAGAAGDCEDIAIEKRFQLIATGYPADRLRFAVVYLPQIGLHTVLIARTQGGDYVLDSRTPYIEEWDQTSYRWVSIQSTEVPSRWYALARRDT